MRALDRLCSLAVQERSNRLQPENFLENRELIVLAAGQAPSEALATEIQDFVKATIAPYKYPRIVTFATALPKTDTGKLQRFRLKESR